MCSGMRDKADSLPGPATSNPGHPNSLMEKRVNQTAIKVASNERRGYVNGPTEPIDQDLVTRKPISRQPDAEAHREALVRILKRPVPSPFYLKKSFEESQKLRDSRQLLVVLDLNGILLHRHDGGNFTAKPHVEILLDYIFAHHKVMIWASSRPKNVQTMCEKVLLPEQLRKLVAIWGRDKLRLSPKLYSQRVQVYKQLTWVWEDEAIQAQNTELGHQWSQRNTVLIDDTIEKGASEPHNLIVIDALNSHEKYLAATIWQQLVAYLKRLSKERNVSAFIRSNPFVYTEKRQC